MHEDDIAALKAALAASELQNAQLQSEVQQLRSPERVYATFRNGTEALRRRQLLDALAEKRAFITIWESTAEIRVYFNIFAQEPLAPQNLHFDPEWRGCKDLQQYDMHIASKNMQKNSTYEYILVTFFGLKVESRSVLAMQRHVVIDYVQMVRLAGGPDPQSILVLTVELKIDKPEQLEEFYKFTDKLWAMKPQGKSDYGFDTHPKFPTLWWRGDPEASKLKPLRDAFEPTTIRGGPGALAIALQHLLYVFLWRMAAPGAPILISLEQSGPGLFKLSRLEGKDEDEQPAHACGQAMLWKEIVSDRSRGSIVQFMEEELASLFLRGKDASAKGDRCFNLAEQSNSFVKIFLLDDASLLVLVITYIFKCVVRECCFILSWHRIWLANLGIPTTKMLVPTIIFGLNEQRLPQLLLGKGDVDEEQAKKQDEGKLKLKGASKHTDDEQAMPAALEWKDKVPFKMPTSEDLQKERALILEAIKARLQLHGLGPQQ